MRFDRSRWVREMELHLLFLVCFDKSNWRTG
ncbi:hypothetical protein MANES_03G084016v8 [Manihot esculenta]|uniref:Uncharacterized protein n=1 Tax=Manihot esculenta TaxID=3983 RepID=A0ACB7I030_MANES|nr:hypothetical protein MANES_03G084016v8 [Manihot esculenta]